MRSFIIIVLIALGACGSSKSAEKRKASPRETKCLPVVQERCGCVYQCASGYRDPDVDRGRWHVAARAWEGKDVRGAVMSWCGAGDTCTPAFSVEVPCEKQCTPAAADATCRFDADKKCVTAADAGGAGSGSGSAMP